MFRSLLTTFAQPSTYAGLAGIAAAAGMSAPAFQTTSGVVAAVCGALAVIIDERGNAKS